MISSQFVETVKTAGGLCIPFVNRIMNSENALKEIVKSFIDLVNMAKRLVDENQQRFVQQELEEVKGGKVKVESFIGLVQVNHLLLKQLIQILVLQHRLPQNRVLQKHGDQKLVETPSCY